MVGWSYLVRLVLTMIVIHLVIHATSQITFHSGFENGRLDTAYLDSGEYGLSPVTNLHFQITAANNEQPG